jgi:LacI family transcriptional regulator
VARSLVTKRTQIVGMVIPELVTALFTDPFFPILLRSATETCNEHRYQLMLSLFSSSADRQEMYERLVGNGYLDGVIVASAALDDPLIPDLLRDGVPFVCIGRHPDSRVRSVDVDNVGGARMAVDYLIRLGHRRIGALTGRLDTAHGQDRLEGYRQALATHQIPLNEDLIVEGDFTEGSGMLAVPVASRSQRSLRGQRYHGGRRAQSASSGGFGGSSGHGSGRFRRYPSGLSD